MGSSDSRLSDTIASRALSGSSLSGRVSLITGPTSGIGYETARVLAANGCHVVLAARDPTKLQKVKQQLIDQIKKEKGESVDPQFSTVHLNLGSLSSIRQAASDFSSLGLPLHYLIANAGVLTGSSGALTSDQFEAQVGTNHLGHYYFTNLLLPIIRSSATSEHPARIILVSSLLHQKSPIRNVNDIESTFITPCKSLTDGYANSKLFNLYHAKYLAKTEKSNNILAFSLHPGVVQTEIARDTGCMLRFILGIIGPFILKNPNQGASTTIYCTLAATAEQSGGYFQDNARTKEAAIGKNEAFQEKVIEISEKIIKEWEIAHPITPSITN